MLPVHKVKFMGLRMIFVIANVACLTAACLAPQSSGDVATGEVFSENGEFLQLNTTPCINQRTLVTFVSPWKKTIGQKRECDKNSSAPQKSYIEVQIRQLALPAPAPSLSPNPSPPPTPAASPTPVHAPPLTVANQRSKSQVAR